MESALSPLPPDELLLKDLLQVLYWKKSFRSASVSPGNGSGCTRMFPPCSLGVM